MGDPSGCSQRLRQGCEQVAHAGQRAKFQDASSELALTPTKA